MVGQNSSAVHYVPMDKTLMSILNSPSRHEKVRQFLTLHAKRRQQSESTGTVRMQQGLWRSSASVVDPINIFFSTPV